MTVMFPQESITALLSFCELPWEEACIADGPINSPVRTASVWQVRQPLNRRSSGRWTNYRAHIEGIIAMVSDV